jgi:hypothetical protein
MAFALRVAHRALRARPHPLAKHSSSARMQRPVLWPEKLTSVKKPKNGVCARLG